MLLLLLSALTSLLSFSHKCSCPCPLPVPVPFLSAAHHSCSANLSACSNQGCSLLIKGKGLALKCNMPQTALWVWWWWTSWNVWTPQVNPFHYMIEQGPPGPPDKVTVEEITDSTAQLSWTPGRDNGSPITGYIIQARTPFTVGWQAIDTGNTDHTFCRQLSRFLSVHFSCHLLKKSNCPFCSARSDQR